MPNRFSKLANRTWHHRNYTKDHFSPNRHALNVDQVRRQNFFFHSSTTSMTSTNLATLLCVVLVALTYGRPLVREIRTDREFQRLLKVRLKATPTTRLTAWRSGSNLSFCSVFLFVCFLVCFFQLFTTQLVRPTLKPNGQTFPKNTNTLPSTTKPKRVCPSLSTTIPTVVVHVVKSHPISKDWPNNTKTKQSLPK